MKGLCQAMAPSIQLRTRPTNLSLLTSAIFATFAVVQYREEAQKRQMLLPCAVLIAVISAFFLFVEPIPQPQSYHNFVDKRGFRCRCGSDGALFLPPTPNVRGKNIIPNFGDVASNVIILLGGLSGVISLILVSSKSKIDSTSHLHGTDAHWQLNVCLPIFFTATVAVSIGSTYYHWNPNDSTLICDRLPMTVAFVAIFCFMLDDYLPPPASLSQHMHDESGIGQVLLAPLVVVGITSVFYWSWTDDLRLYAIVSILPLLIMPTLVIWYRPRHTGVPQQILGLVLYSAAKICEEKDHEIFHWTGMRVSGHSLKHIFAGLAPCSIAYMILIREELQ